MSPNLQPHPALAELRNSQIDLIASLHERGFGFDLGDELMLSEMGSAEDGLLRIGSCTYETVILPRGTVNFLSAALPALKTPDGPSVLYHGQLGSG